MPHKSRLVASLVAAGVVGFGLPALAMPPESACGDLLIILDRSTSMSDCRIDGSTKEAHAKAAIKAVIDKFPATPMGLAVFPYTVADCGGVCATGQVVLDVETGGGKAVTDYLASMPTSCGGTPTGTTLQTMQDYDKFTAGKKHYVLLITDGVPTCDDGFTDETMATACDGMGMMECKNPSKAFDAVQHLADRGIHTFVVGFEGDGFGASCKKDVVNPATLNKLADLGGEPATTSGSKHYYSAIDRMSLDSALDKIVGTVAGATVGYCTSGAKDGAAGGEGGTGGAGGGGGQGGQGDLDAGGEPDADDHGAMHGAPGCGCRTSDGGTAAGLFFFFGLGLALAGTRRGRSR